MEKTTKENEVKKSIRAKKEQANELKSTKTTTSDAKSKKTSTKTSETSPKKKNAVSKTPKRSSTTNKSVASNTITKSSTSKKTTTAAKKRKPATKKLEDSPKMKIDILEYYDLPYRYNQTIVKLLFQTPKTLFVYWDITDEDRKNYQEQYGENFFEDTKPVLVIHNETMNYSFEIEINDFANSWYFNIPNPNCKYVIELGRRPKNPNISLPDNYLYITSSNQLASPNDRILFNNNGGKVVYKNAKTHQLSEKDFGSITFMNNLKHIYSISEFYHKIYEENILDELENQSIKNPSSGIL